MTQIHPTRRHAMQAMALALAITLAWQPRDGTSSAEQAGSR